jgi:hypothetical protein
MATPHVSGVAALIWTQNPNLNPDQVKQILANSTRKINALSGKTITGGVVNADQALAITPLPDGSSPPPPPPAPAPPPPPPSPGAPLAPSNLTGAFSKGLYNVNLLNLAWKDNSDNETRFEIQRARTTTGPFTSIATVGANITSATLSTGYANVFTYYYRIRAVNNAGESFSNVIMTKGSLP